MVVAEIERTVLEIWRDVLQDEAIALDDDFFDLGGHSLLVGHIEIQAQRRFGVSIPLEDFYDLGTAREMARRICELLSEQRSAPCST